MTLIVQRVSLLCLIPRYFCYRWCVSLNQISPPSKVLKKNKPPGGLNRGFTVITDVIRTFPFYYRKRNYWDNNMQACSRCSDRAEERQMSWRNSEDVTGGVKEEILSLSFSSSSLFLFFLSAHWLRATLHYLNAGGGGTHMKGVGMLVVSLMGVNLAFWPH